MRMCCCRAAAFLLVLSQIFLAAAHGDVYALRVTGVGLLRVPYGQPPMRAARRFCTEHALFAHSSSCAQITERLCAGLERRLRRALPALAASALCCEPPAYTLQVSGDWVPHKSGGRLAGGHVELRVYTLEDGRAVARDFARQHNLPLAAARQLEAQLCAAPRVLCGSSSDGGGSGSGAGGSGTGGAMAGGGSSSACTNGAEYSVGHRALSVWTMLVGTADEVRGYVRGAVKLALSVRAHSSAELDLVVMEAAETPLARSLRAQLRGVGWRLCTVRRLAPPIGTSQEARTLSRYTHSWTKLHLWNMTQYGRVLFMDSDTLVVGGIDELLRMRQVVDGSARIGAARDFGGGWKRGFNGGVLALRPDAAEFSRLMRIWRKGFPSEDSAPWARSSMAEQGFLNHVFAGQWADIGFVHNANLAIYGGTKRGDGEEGGVGAYGERKAEKTQQEEEEGGRWGPAPGSRNDIWLPQAHDIRVIHYTMQKPWEACSRLYIDLCELWRRAPPRAARRRPAAAR